MKSLFYWILSFFKKRKQPNLSVTMKYYVTLEDGTVKEIPESEFPCKITIKEIK